MDEFKLTIACFPGGLWIIGRKEKISGGEYLAGPVIFIHGTQGMGLLGLPGISKRTSTYKLPIVDCLFDYVVDDPQIEDLYVEHTTGVKPMRAPLITPEIPRGGGGPRLVH